MDLFVSFGRIVLIAGLGALLVAAAVRFPFRRRDADGRR